MLDVVAKAKSLAEAFSTKGEWKAVDAFREFIQLLLAKTILADGERVVRVKPKENGSDALVSGCDSRPLRLRDGRFLRIHFAIRFNRKHLAVVESGYQYQTDMDGRNWIFRYDYERAPRHRYPGGDHGARDRTCNSTGAWPMTSGTSSTSTSPRGPYR